MLSFNAFSEYFVEFNCFHLREINSHEKIWVLTVVSMILVLSWVLDQFGFVDGCQCFGETYCLHL
jgi:hypothetical protein